MRNTLIKTSSLFLFFISTISLAQQKNQDSVGKWDFSYGSKGLEIVSPDKNYALNVQSRFQFRFATPNDQDPISFDDFNDENNTAFKINRARLKVGGHAYKNWIQYYWEYDFSNSSLLDFRVMIERWEWLKLKIGQWKVEYSRERRISSGEQQLVDRSILNRPFTIDRQQGLEVYGRLKNNGFLDFSYWLAVLTGTGRGSSTNDDNHLMYFGRLQWNLLGEDIGFESSDLEFHETPEAIIAVAAVTNRSLYTRFSTSGGGELIGYEDAENGQYRINQINFETAFVYQGFSWQSEFHTKRIIDKLNNNTSTTLRGYYVQAGLLGNSIASWWPKPLEIAARYAHYVPDHDILQNNENEFSVGLNWFFKEHKNKLTVEFSKFDYETVDGLVDNTSRFRIQWDISF
ncbi:MAG: porin [Flavobacteriaceae bacterium]|nr:porin [Mangrovimonas sp.]MCB0431877.1 porin [Mangrovimonas sp.]MCB0438388.1 porin [Mangrovimonas sp.]HRV54575.1 porin [Mangrovimonas sp.]